ncbi:hypothetical protein MJM99_35725, partial [Salmonella enterica subsp. enterica serovar Kentucky]|nr:hypothetical protein [Salmonella enterica subsp. enterica serovar Kentucky]
PQPGIKIGYLPQEPQLNPEHTVRESIEEAVSEVVNALKRLDDESHITDKTYWAPPQLYVTSSAMVAGSTDGGYGDATAINT